MGLVKRLKAAYSAFQSAPKDLDVYRVLGREFAEGVGARFRGWPDKIYNPDDLLRARGKTVELYLDMMRDDTVRAAILKKTLSVCGLGREVIAGDKSLAAQNAAAFVRWMLFQRLDGTFSQKLFQMLSACLTGFSIHEQVWDVETEGPWAGKLILSKLKHRDPSDFTFKTDQALNVISLIQKQRAAAEVSLDPKKFLLYSYLAWFSNPYGSADGRSVYRTFIIKDMAWKMRAIYTEKFAMPSLVGKYPGGQVTHAQKDAFFSAIAQYQSDTGILIPADLALEALEISTQGNTVFAETIKDLNDSICTAILLGFLQMGEGKNTGALRAGEVHERSESVFVAYLAEDVAEVFNEQVIQPLVRWNFGANVACPYLAIRTQKNKDLTLELNILEKASALGLLISEEETYERLGLRKPGPGEVVLEPRQAPTPTHPVFPFGSAVKPANYAAQPPRNQIQLLAEAAIAGGKKAGDALLAADLDVLKKKSLK